CLSVYCLSSVSPEATRMLNVLDGVRLIEVAEWFFVPGAGTVIADWGGDVIKIEHPTRGDPLRGLISSGIIPGATGLNFFIESGIAAALYHREKTGQGSVIDVSLLGTAVWLMAPDILAALLLGHDLPHNDRTRAPNPLMNTYLCKDSTWLMLMMLTPMRHWEEFCKAIEREDLLAEFPLMTWIDEPVRFK